MCMTARTIWQNMVPRVFEVPYIWMVRSSTYTLNRMPNASALVHRLDWTIWRTAGSRTIRSTKVAKLSPATIPQEVSSGADTALPQRMILGA